jgi:hypothetical protein
LFEVSGLRNTAYSQFYILQFPQVNATRTAVIQANVSFDYDAPGKLNIRIGFLKKKIVFVLGAIRVWYLFVIAEDNGTPQRQCKC